MNETTEIPETMLSLINSALRQNAKLAVLVDFGNMQGACYCNIGDHPLEVARYLEKFARDQRKDAKR